MLEGFSVGCTDGEQRDRKTETDLFQEIRRGRVRGRKSENESESARERIDIVKKTMEWNGTQRQITICEQVLITEVSLFL